MLKFLKQEIHFVASSVKLTIFVHWLVVNGSYEQRSYFYPAKSYRV